MIHCDLHFNHCLCVYDAWLQWIFKTNSWKELEEPQNNNICLSVSKCNAQAHPIAIQYCHHAVLPLDETSAT